MYKKIELSNGLKVVLNHMAHMESAAIGIWIASGSRNETEKLSGISHFIEHMVFKGTPSRSSRKIKEEIEGNGGSLNGFTSEEVTCYLAKLSGRHTNKALEVLSDIILNASLDPKELERERPVIIEEIKMYQDLPNQYVHEILNEIMWPGHALGLSIAGNIGSVSSITRGDLSSFKNKFYVPGNIVITICGNFNEASALQKIKEIFMKRTKPKTSSFIKYNRSQSSPRIKILNKDTHQAHLSMGVRTFGRDHEDRYVLGLLHIILGANMSSRLFENIREKKGLAYEIGSEIKRYKETGAFVVNAGTEHKKVKEVVRLVIKELQKIKSKQVPGNELKRAKEFIKVQLLLALEDTLDHMLWLGEYMTRTGKPPDKNKIIKKITSVSSSDLKRVANKVFKSENLNLAIIGSLGDNEKREIEKGLEL